MHVLTNGFRAEHKFGAHRSDACNDDFVAIRSLSWQSSIGDGAE